MAAYPLVFFQLLILFLFLLLNPFPTASAVGINYGTLGNNLPAPKRVAQLLQSTLIDKVKIYDSNPEILEAFSNTGIDLIVAVENYHVANLTSSSAADQWLVTRVLPFIPATSVVAVAVGNEYLTTDVDLVDPNALVQAMQNLHSALVSRGLDRKIKVTTPHSMAVLASSFPPSSSTFATTLVPTMTSIIELLADTGAPFMVNAYPYFAYRDNPTTISLEYALLGNSTRVRDPKGYMYSNMLDAQIDAVRSAIRPGVWQPVDRDNRLRIRVAVEGRFRGIRRDAGERQDVQHEVSRESSVQQRNADEAQGQDRSVRVRPLQREQEAGRREREELRDIQRRWVQSIRGGLELPVLQRKRRGQDGVRGEGRMGDVGISG